MTSVSEIFKRWGKPLDTAKLVHLIGSLVKWSLMLTASVVLVIVDMGVSRNDFDPLMLVGSRYFFIFIFLYYLRKCSRKGD
jgi:hypothetical protein